MVTMKNKYWWIFGVAIIATTVFFIPERTGEIWTPVLSAMAVVGIFYVGLLVYIFKNGDSTAGKMIGVGVIGLFVALVIFNGVNQYSSSTFQHKTLTKVRSVIDRGLITVYSQEALLKSLQTYHNGTNHRGLTLEEIFRERYGDDIQSGSGLTRFIPDDQKEHSGESPFIYYKDTKNSNKLVLIGQSLLAKGRDSTFKNYNGQKGLLQYRATLTKDGVDYVREN